MIDYFQERFEKFNVLDQNKSDLAPMVKNALIELTNVCNHKCTFCYNPLMKRPRANLDLKVYSKFLKNAVAEGLEEIGLYSTGEPFMTKNLDEYIKIAKNIGVKRVYITTNGALASVEKIEKCIKNGLDSIKFSINAGSKETYKIIHGHDDFEKVINNVKNLYKLKLKKKYNLQTLCTFVYTDKTINEIEKFEKKYSKFFDHLGFFAPNNQGGRTLDQSRNLSKTFSNKKNIKKIKNDIKPCHMLWSKIHFTADGEFTACCVDYENDLVYDKFDENKKVSDQFNSEKIRYLRKLHLEKKLDGTICKGCLYNTKEKYVKLRDHF